MAFGGVVEAGDEVDEGGFARAGFAENAEFGACRNMEIHIFKHGVSGSSGKAKLTCWKSMLPAMRVVLVVAAVAAAVLA